MRVLDKYAPGNIQINSRANVYLQQNEKIIESPNQSAKYSKAVITLKTTKVNVFTEQTGLKFTQAGKTKLRKNNEETKKFSKFIIKYPKSLLARFPLTNKKNCFAKISGGTIKII